MSFCDNYQQVKKLLALHCKKIKLQYLIICKINSMKKTLSIIFCLLVFVSLAFANFIFLEYSANPSNNSVIVEWVTKSESGVSRFVVLRSYDDQNFVEIGAVVAEKAGHNYTFTDDNVLFKDSQTFFYKLRAVRADDSSIEETQSLIVHPNISGIYRTWGAIKELFK
jgi:hypothetical protein